MLQKLKEHRVYSYGSRAEAEMGRDENFVKTWWVRTEKGDDVRSRCVAQELANGGPPED